MKILIICTGNSCRSQIAEGFFKHYKKDWEIYSAGISPKGLNPYAIDVMLEKGIDISNQTSDSIDIYISNEFDYVITVCDRAKETCPVFLNAKTSLHWGFMDPADVVGTYEERINKFREVRDQIEEKITQFLKEFK